MLLSNLMLSVHLKGSPLISKRKHCGQSPMLIFYDIGKVSFLYTDKLLNIVITIQTFEKSGQEAGYVKCDGL